MMFNDSKGAGNRRYRVGYVEPATLVRWLDAASRPAEWAAFPYFPDLPGGYEVVQVSYDASRACWAILFYHGSWRSIDYAEMIPVVDLMNQVTQGGPARG